MPSLAFRWIAQPVSVGGPPLGVFAVQDGKHEHVYRCCRTDWGWLVRKLDDEGAAVQDPHQPYHVVLDGPDAGCSCPAGVYRDADCRHTRALRELTKLLDRSTAQNSA